MRKVVAAVALVVLLASVACRPDTSSTSGSSCDRLAKFTISGARVVSTDLVAAGGFTPAVANGDASMYKALPAFCRVRAEATPSADSHIKIEVWLPQAQMNGKFLAVGNGGFAGEVNYQEMAQALSRGYVTASTDTGHEGTAIDASWALGHPEKIVDFGHRGIHEMTRVAKAVMKESSGSEPKKSYFAGCSNGGRQALMEAQRYPDDYDGILAGAPANYWTHLVTGSVWDAQSTTTNPASYIPSSKIPAIARAVNAACDPQDGVRDGIVSDPRQCHFRPASLKCRGAESEKCLTAPQVTALEKLYGGTRDSKGIRIFPGLLPGAEDGFGGWSLWITGAAPGKGLLFNFGSGFFANMVYSKADWDFKQADVDEIVKVADGDMAKILNATDANLRPFAAHGGKLLLYHGWNDPAISALNTIDYFQSVVGTLGQSETDSTLRLFMVPGMQHCAGGPGPDSFGQSGTSAQPDPAHDAQLALEQWVEAGTAPSEMIAVKYSGKAAKLARPLCAFPRAAKYKGSGSSDEASSFVCAD